MAKSESAAQEWTLATAPAGQVVEVVAVGDADPAVLLVHGVREGAHLTVEGDAPLGGPRIVRVGTSRVAIDRRLAATVAVTPAVPLRRSPA
jgi:Fe2+ transport system protein FeoA